MSGSIVLDAIVIVGAGLAALGVLAWARLGEYRRARRSNRPDQECSLERYRPLARLLAREDADFLRQNSICPKVAARWERSQGRIIRFYLKELAADFHRLHANARALVAESPEQYAGLVPLLFRQQATFWRTLAMIELRLILGGLKGRKIHAEELVRVIEVMQREISRMAAASAA